MNIFTYWVSPPDQEMPIYLKLCMATWHENITNVHITVINHSNIQQFLPAELLTENFFKLSLPMQSDVVSAAVLLEQGGIFMDADTIATKDPFSSPVFNSDKFISFGYPATHSIHLAVLACRRKNHPLLNK